MVYDINQLLKNALTNNASDLHLTVNSPPVYRINGRLTVEDEELLTPEHTEKMARQLIPDEDWNRFMKEKEMDFSYSLKDISRYRVHVFYRQQHISIVIRVIPKNIPTLDDLNMPEVLKQLVLKPQGMIIVTGPTGSGKSTTLSAMINYINQYEAKHIITLEDPIEYEHRHQKSIINQREVGVDTNSFHTGIRAALRQDPDIILVGEMRDLETMETAITAAETGHLVLATLHTSNAVETINRIIGVFPPNQQPQIRNQLASVLNGVISQRLIPTADKSGRKAATEILLNLPSVANLIRNEKVEQISNIMQTSRAQGMHTLEMSIRDLINKNEIDPVSAEIYLTDAGEN